MGTNKNSKSEVLNTTCVSGSVYCFNPQKHGFESIKNHPELDIFFSDSVFVKIVCYINNGDLCYWYKAISLKVGFDDDNRIEIFSGSYSFLMENDFEPQNKPTTVFIGLITNDAFAESLLKHLLGTNKNSSLKEESITRYKENIGIKMRSEFPQHYR